MSSSEEHEYFSDGMTEEVINALTKIEGLRVTSRTSSFYFKGKNIPIPQIGQELNVATVLEGSIRLSGNKMRLTAQLIDVANDIHFFSEVFDRPLDDVFAVQDEISLLIANKLREHFGHFDISQRLVAHPAIPVNAYIEYMKGRHYLLKMNPPDLKKGMAILEEVIAQAPDFPMAYLGMHLAHALLGTIGFAPADESFLAGKPYLDKAIALNPNLPECQLQLCYRAFLQDWDLPAADRYLNACRELSPVVEFYQSMASILVAEGKFKAALNYIDTAVQIDPLSHINCHLKGFIFYVQEQHAEAMTWFKKSIDLNPQFMASTLYFGLSLLASGRLEEGLTYFEQLPPASDDMMKPGGTTLAHIMLGHPEEAAAGMAQLQATQDSTLNERGLNFLLLCQAQAGNKAETIKTFEDSISLRLPMLMYLFVEPLMKPMREVPRFQELMKSVLGQTPAIDRSKRKYKKKLFSPDLLEQNVQALNLLMTDKQPYLDPELSLRSLAQLLDLPPNHLSQLLNEGFDKNFSAFVNAYRLEAFKQKAADPANQQFTILALAYDSGFNSKTVFNTFFKKEVGMTPTAYWKEVKGG
jgi:TolB-like protein/AraC-like DNA-binding protein